MFLFKETQKVPYFHHTILSIVTVIYHGPVSISAKLKIYSLLFLRSFFIAVQNLKKLSFFREIQHSGNDTRKSANFRVTITAIIDCRISLPRHRSFLLVILTIAGYCYPEVGQFPSKNTRQSVNLRVSLPGS